MSARWMLRGCGSSLSVISRLLAMADPVVGSATSCRQHRCWRARKPALGAVLFFLLRDFLALLAGLRQSDGNRLLAALDLPALASRSALGLALLIAVHLVLDVFTGTTGIFAFLRHVTPSAGVPPNQRNCGGFVSRQAERPRRVALSG